ncbi:mechanosensitive ion channel family protein [Spirochaeta dissipatitropha]
MNLISTIQGILYLSAVLILTALLVVCWLIHALVFHLLKRQADRRERDTMRIFLRRSGPPSRRLLLSAVIWFSLSLFNLEPEILELIRHVLSLLMILLTAILAAVLVHAGSYLMLRRFNTNVPDNLSARKVTTQVKVFERIIIALIILIAVSTALMTFDGVQQIGSSLLASAGIAGLILGVAAQKSLGNVVAGIMIAITQPIRLDDAVVIENEWGWIEEITLTYVVVRIWDKRRLVVPINYFVDQPFQNWTRTSSDILGSVTLHVDYRTPVDLLRRKQSEILAGTELWDGQVDVIQVVDSTPTTMILRSLISASNSPRTWDLRVLIREELISYLQQEHPEYLPRTRVDMNPQSHNKDIN